jgi:hypothetical protein
MHDSTRNLLCLHETDGCDRVSLATTRLHRRAVLAARAGQRSNALSVRQHVVHTLNDVRPRAMAGFSKKTP